MFAGTDSRCLRRGKQRSRGINPSLEVRTNSSSAEGSLISLDLHERTSDRRPTQCDIHQLSEAERRWQFDDVSNARAFLLVVLIKLNQRRWLIIEEIRQRQFKTEETDMDVRRQLVRYGVILF